MQCLVCRLSVDNGELEKHFRSHDHSEFERFSCHLCVLKFLKFSSLVKHLHLVHSKAKTRSFSRFCSEMRKIKEDAYKQLPGSDILSEDAFEEVELDVSHLDNDETAENDCLSSEQARKSYVCEFEDCKKVFVHYTSYVSHGKCVHSELRNFTCDQCPKSFKTSSNLYVHLKQHNNQRDHSCQLCPLSFFTSSHLKAHLKIHSKETRYSCDVEGCGKSFIHLSSFKKHVNFHRGLKAHQCNVCQRHFSQSCHLREHLKTHTNERNHRCPTCQKAFRRPDTMRIHLKTHDS